MYLLKLTVVGVILFGCKGNTTSNLAATTTPNEADVKQIAQSSYFNIQRFDTDENSCAEVPQFDMKCSKQAILLDSETAESHNNQMLNQTEEIETTEQNTEENIASEPTSEQTTAGLYLNENENIEDSSEPNPNELEENSIEPNPDELEEIVTNNDPNPNKLYFSCRAQDSADKKNYLYILIDNIHKCYKVTEGENLADGKISIEDRFKLECEGTDNPGTCLEKKLEEYMTQKEQNHNQENPDNSSPQTPI